MNQHEIQAAAKAFREARHTQTPISPASDTYPSMDVASALKIAKASIDMGVNEEGDRIVGYKLGNVARVMQVTFGVDEPDYGYLPASSFKHEGTPLQQSDFIAPFIELEPAFKLKSGLKGPHLTAADVISAVEYVVPAVEIIDSRVRDWAIKLEDTVADCGSNAAIILGGQPRLPTDPNLDLGNCRGSLRFNGADIAAGTTRNILGNPYAAVAWLVNKLAEFGIEIEAGSVVLPGSCLEAMPMRQPGRWECEYEGWGTIVLDVV